jgi:dolichol-phosphate mannosyltransferase
MLFKSMKSQAFSINMKKKALVVVPTYNEAENIERLILAIKSQNSKIKNYNLEVLVVDDNSPDGTSNIVRSLQKRFKNIHLLSGKKAGLGRAYIRGFNYAISTNKYSALIMIDADFSHNPISIPELLNKIDQNYDYVIGSRYIQGGAIPGNWPIKRILNSRVANLLARKLTGLPDDINDITGGYKAIRIEALKQIDIDRIQATGYFFQVNLLHLFITGGFKVVESPIIFNDRKFGESKLRFRDIVEFVYRSYKLNPNSPVRRLARFLLVGLSGTLVNLITLYILVQHFKGSVLLDAVAATEISIISNFILNYIYTFGTLDSNNDPTSIISKFSKFNMGSLGGAAISLFVFSVLYKSLGINYIFADACSIATATSWNYWISTRVVWKIVDAKA